MILYQSFNNSLYGTPEEDERYWEGCESCKKLSREGLWESKRKTLSKELYVLIVFLRFR